MGSTGIALRFLLVSFARSRPSSFASQNLTTGTTKTQHVQQLQMYMASVVDLAYLLGVPLDDFVIFGVLVEVIGSKIELYAMHLVDYNKGKIPVSGIQGKAVSIPSLSEIIILILVQNLLEGLQHRTYGCDEFYLTNSTDLARLIIALRHICVYDNKLLHTI